MTAFRSWLDTIPAKHVLLRHIHSESLSPTPVHYVAHSLPSSAASQASTASTSLPPCDTAQVPN